MNNTVLKSYFIDEAGKTYFVEIVSDDLAEPPWRNSDTFASPIYPERGELFHRELETGQWVILHNGSYKGLEGIYYPYHAGLQVALEEPDFTLERAKEDVQDEIQRFRSYLNDEWQYTIVDVSPMCPCCGQPDRKKSRCMGGVESDCDGEYLQQIVRELIAEISC